MDLSLLYDELDKFVDENLKDKRIYLIKFFNYNYKPNDYKIILFKQFKYDSNLIRFYETEFRNKFNLKNYSFIYDYKTRLKDNQTISIFITYH